MELIKLPEKIKYDLKGYRGFNNVIMPLRIIYIKEFNAWSAHYTCEEAEYTFAVEFGRTREEAIEKLRETLSKNKQYKFYYHV